MNFTMHLKKWAFNFILASILAFITSIFVLYSQNTLLLNDNWIAVKRTMVMVLMGADEFLIERNSLAQNRLNLATHYGYHEVSLKNALRIKQIELEVALIDLNSSLDIKLESASTIYLWRISKNRDRPSTFMQVNPEGFFFDHRAIDLTDILPTHNFVHFAISPHKIELWLNNIKVSTVDNKLGDTTRLSFKSGEAPVSLDNITITQSDGDKIAESFSNTKNFANLYFYTLSLIMIFLFIMEISFLLLKCRRETFLFVQPTILLSVTFVVSILYLYDFYYWSNHSFNHRSKVLHGEEVIGISKRLDKIRFDALAHYYRWTGGKQPGHQEIFQIYPEERIWSGPIFCQDTKPCAQKAPSDDRARDRARSKKLLLIGSSQSLGIGAKNLDDTFFVKMHKILSAKPDKPHPIESLNISVAGADTSFLMAHYQKNVTSFIPDLVIFNLSFNDQDKFVFHHTLDKFISLFPAGKTKCVLVQEAADFDSHADRHKMLEDLALKHSCQLIKLHQYMKSKEVYNSCHLWWDLVHLSSTGQDIVARWLAPQIEDLLYP